MSTRTHWGGPNGHRACNHGKTAQHREVSAAEFLRLPNLCRTCERVAQKEQQPRPRSCKHCGSQAINPGFRERPQGIDLDLCDVCFWRVRAQPEPRPIEEAPNTAILAWCPATEELTEGWEVVYPSNQPGWWCGNGELHQPTHFLPLPPKPEVRK